MQILAPAALRALVYSLLLIALLLPVAGAASHSPSSAVLEGELVVEVADFPDGRSQTRHFLDTRNGRVELKFNRHQPQLASGTRVRMRGNLQGGVLALDGAQEGSIETLASASSATLGEQRVAVILVNFQDDASQPLTSSAAGSLVFGSVDTFYRANSFQQTWLAGDVHGWFNIPVSRTTCNTELISQHADQAATAAGVDLSRYARKVYMFPANACTWAGLATVGGSPSRAWINGVFDMRVVGHELGHTFGLVHAGGLDCDTGVMTGTCRTLTYGDAADMMGNRAVHFNASEKEQLGWLNDGVSPPIAIASTSGRHAIEPYSASSVGTKAIKIPRGPDPVSGKARWYYVEYRQPIGADAGIANTGTLTKGVLLRTRTEGDGSGSLLLDMTPDSDPSSGFADLEDGALLVGRSYTDSNLGVTVTLVSADSSGAVVDVSYGGVAPACTRAAPALAVSGGGSQLPAGATASYTVTLTNRDSSACAATSFSLAKSLPAGWSGALSGSSFAVAPGATATATLSVTSSSTAAAGSYGIGVGAGSGVGSVHTTNAAATYAVAAQAATLTEAIGTDKTSYVRGETVHMSSLVRRDGIPLAGAAVKFTVSLPGGIQVVLNATSGSDGFARATYKTGKGKAAIGSYALRADASSGAVTATAATAFTVR